MGKTLLNVQVYGGVCIERISIKISCMQEDCDSSMSIPLSLGNTIPQIPLMCFGCNSSLMIITKFETHGQELTPITNSPIYAELMDGAIDLPKQDQSQGGPDILPSFINRWATVFVMIEEINEIVESTGVDIIDVRQILVNFSDTSFDLHENLVKLEKIHKIGRGERLSDAFPIRDGPKNITFRSILGVNRNGLVPNGGLLQKIGFIDFIDQDQFRVRTSGERSYSEISSVKNLLHYISKDGLSTEQRILGEYPRLIVYYPEDLTRDIVNLVKLINSDEYYWMLHLLSMIDEATSKDPDFGWDSNTYALDRTENCSGGLCHIRWDQKWQKYLQQGESRKSQRKIRNAEDFAKDRLMMHINSTLGGALGRMKELGLIYPRRIGLTKNFLISDLGKEILDRESDANE